MGNLPHVASANGSNAEKFHLLNSARYGPLEREIQRGDLVEAAKLAGRFLHAVEFRQRSQQPLIGAIGSRRRQRRFVELLNIIAYDSMQQTAHRPLFRVIGGKLEQFKLKGFEGLETRVLA
jgi:hypothetical protein